MLEWYEFFQFVEACVEVIPNEEEIRAAGEKVADVLDLQDHAIQGPQPVRLIAELTATISSG